MRKRDIITEKDVETIKLLKTNNKIDAETTIPTTDDFYDRLMKYIPVEIVGGYIIVEGILSTMLEGKQLENSLLVILIVGVVGVLLTLKGYFNIHRAVQVIMSMFAFIVWVFFNGGWFKEFYDFWQQGWGTIAVVVFAIVVRYMRLPVLPEETLMKLSK